MPADQSTIIELKNMANRMRIDAIELAFKAGKNGAHLGGGLSAIEILAVLYGYAMNYSKEIRQNPSRDRFLLSKGHGTLAYYTALHEVGLITKQKLYTFEDNGGELPGQPVRNPELGIEISSGSLGLGLPIGVGMALAAKLQERTNRVYVLLGDGECNEGSVWEAAMSAIKFGLNNIVAIVDKNNLQSDGTCEDVFCTAPLANMWQGFGWHVIKTDGHDVRALCSAFDECQNVQSPCVLLAQTVKGKGVGFMENNRLWHHGALTQEQYEQAMREVQL